VRRAGSSSESEIGASACKEVSYIRGDIKAYVLAFRGVQAEQMDKIDRVITDLSKQPLPGDIFELGDDNYITIVSVRPGEISYAPGAFESNMFRLELLSSTIRIPHETFREWLASIATERRMDTPPHG